MVRALLVPAGMHPALRRHVEPRPFPTARYVLAGAACGFAGLALTFAIVHFVDVKRENQRQEALASRAEPVLSPALTDDPDGIASRTAAALSLEAFPAWVVSHPDTMCPARLADLLPYASAAHALDPWGTPYTFDCDGTHFHVRSAGRDRTFATPDDIGAGS